MLWKIDVGKTMKKLQPCSEEIGVQPPNPGYLSWRFRLGANILEITVIYERMRNSSNNIAYLVHPIDLISGRCKYRVYLIYSTPQILQNQHFSNKLFLWLQDCRSFFLYFNTSSLLTITVNGDRWMMLVRIRMLLWKGLSHNAKVTKSAGIVENF